jgi:hypothetical protein
MLMMISRSGQNLMKTMVISPTWADDNDKANLGCGRPLQDYWFPSGLIRLLFYTAKIKNDK